MWKPGHFDRHIYTYLRQLTAQPYIYMPINLSLFPSIYKYTREMDQTNYIYSIRIQIPDHDVLGHRPRLHLHSSKSVCVFMA